MVKQGNTLDAMALVRQTLEEGKQSGQTKESVEKNVDLRIHSDVLLLSFQSLDEASSPTNPDVATMAEELLEMEYALREQGQTGGIFKHYSNVIRIWRNVGGPETGEKAQAILERAFQHASDSQDWRDLPSSIDCFQVIMLYIETDQLEQADYVLSNAPNPDEICYKVVVQAYAKAGNLDKVGDLLRQCTERGILLEARVCNGILNVWSKEANTQGKNAVAQMEDAYKAIQVPDSFSNTHRLNTYANARDPKGAEDAFRDIVLKAYEMPEIYPPANIVYINILIKAWMQSNEDDKYERALNILTDVGERHQNGQLDFGLNVVTYNTLMQGYAKKGLAQDATRLYQQMVEDCQMGNTQAKPDTFTFNHWLKSLAVLRSPTAGQQADLVLEQMKEQGIEPNEYTYATGIRCWKVTQQSTEGPEKEQASGRLQELIDLIGYEKRAEEKEKAQ